MHDAPNRQLIAVHIALLLLLVATPQAWAQDSRPPSMVGELQAAKLMQAALAAREATPEEWRKLDDAYSSLITRNPRDVAVRSARAEFLWQRGDQAGAITEWQIAEKFDPKNAEILSHLGDGFLARGEARKAADYYARAAASSPASAPVHFALANVQFLFRHELLDEARPDAASVLDSALAHFAEASRLAPENADYARAYAETFYSVQKPDWVAALSAWQTVQRLNLQPDFALLNQARIHLKLGQFDAARRSLQQIQAPDYQKLKSRLEKKVAAEAKTPLAIPSFTPDFEASTAR